MNWFAPSDGLPNGIVFYEIISPGGSWALLPFPTGKWKQALIDGGFRERGASEFLEKGKKMESDFTLFQKMDWLRILPFYR